MKNYNTIILFFLLLVLISFWSCKQEEVNLSKPNIILIMADDMGYSDIGCFGSEISTPNLDKLGYEGMRITQFYNASRCCPSRAALLTGLYPHQAGIGDMVGDWGIPAYHGYLNDQCITLGEALKLSGYSTYISGKWHVGEERPHWPLDRGFDRYFGLIQGASSYFDIRQYRKSSLPDHPQKVMAFDSIRYYPPDSGFYMTDAFVEHAIEFLDYHEEKNDESPFFLYLPFNAPHWPLHALPEDIEKYKGKYMSGWSELREERFLRMKDLGIFKNVWEMSPAYSAKVPEWDSLSIEEKEIWDLRMAVYAAMIDRMDQGIGRILDLLDKKGQSENTLIVFIADNGGCHEEIFRSDNFVRKSEAPIGTQWSFDAYGFPWANASNTPFQLFKHWTMEGGIATPFIAYWPGKIKPGISHEVGHIIDIMPTFLEVAEGNYPESFHGKNLIPVEGESLIPVLFNNGNYPERTLFWEHEGNKAMRWEGWKIVSVRHPGNDYDKSWQLYDMDMDRTELRDVSNIFPYIKRNMLKEYESWEKRAGVLDYDSLLKTFN